LGLGNRAQVVASITARGLLNMSAIAGTPVGQYG
jgi:malate dehydrogenase (oxaloacetate-decarboxylating)(NADP+)